ncbi:SAM-dependent DNA methyltransferase [Shewanella canadensis]|uniref:site-specific DNA-methyltransferase (adenine-specific) n=1 Tax=Shewanella canadensis TaxID=271096 RepID=A0A431WSN1_9GAMM|nr:class I SAM-dependent DNA methyltransferase [Shewanella canadensis]RTR38433.1 SAM-dependent DNA methyltransferase [Shewanella canadensis]
MSISSTIKSIQNIMRKDAGIDGDAQRLGQLSWLLFLKIFDTLEEDIEEELGDTYVSPIPTELLWRNWAKGEKPITGDLLLEFINNELFPSLKKLPVNKAVNPRSYVVKQAFEDAYNYMKNGTLLRQLIDKIDNINFGTSDERHLFGDMYEQILKDLQAAGNAGEFYTPRAVTRFMVEQVNPQLGEKLIDPACGTGGFLTCSINHIKPQCKDGKDFAVLQQQINGVEKKQLPHLLCVTNLMLHGIEVPSNIRHGNTLEKNLREWKSDQKFDVIITNPPFGGTEEDGIEHNFPAATRTRETADLFLQLIIHVLKDNGRAAIVLPDGSLFGEGVITKIKAKLLAECNLHTIVRLPNGVFNPYTGIKTNILFFTKGQPTKEVWFYEHPYPAGVKNYNKTKPMKFEEFETEMSWWGNEADGFASRVETEQAWKVSIDDIIARNYNLDIKNPHVGEVISHDPQELLQDYAKQQADIQALRDQLKGILSAALAPTAVTPVKSGEAK